MPGGAYLVDTNNLTGYAQIVEELRTRNQELTTSRTYTFGHALLTQSQLLPDPHGTETWTTSTYLHDGQGTIWALADETGQLTDRYRYEALGTLLTSSGPTPNNILYTAGSQKGSREAKRGRTQNLNIDV